MTEQDLGYRRIQHTGRDSYIISLPKEWILAIGLKKGDQLAFKTQEDSSLLLVPRKVMEGKIKLTEAAHKEFTVQITSKDDPQSISRRIKSLYAVSADLVRIKFKEGELTHEQRKAIKNTVRMLLGSEIISESPNEISVQILINHPEFPIENAVRRMFAIATAMDMDAFSLLKSFDEQLIQGIISSDEDLDRLSLYVIRQLKYGVEHNLFKEMGFRTPKEFLGYRTVASNLENIGDNAVSTARNFLALKRLINGQILTLTKPIDEEVYTSILELHSFAHRLLDDSLKALFKRDYYLADDVISLFISTGLQLEKNAVNLLFNMKIDPNMASILRLILDNSKKIMEYGRDIAEVTLNRTVEEISST
ncbi:MAG: phosphate uptake regulator PhoU [Candidatus Bathyarchaeia archaeon]